MLIDTHNHIYLDAFENDREAILERMKAAGIHKCYMPAIDAAHWPAMMKTHKVFSHCVPMPGLHPCSVNEGVQAELEFVEELLPQDSWPALGEIGLDYYWDTSFAAQQKEAFNTQMQWALDHDLPVVIHTRNAMADTIECVKPFAQRGLRGIFHCFSGTAADAAEIISMNFMLGIGGVVTYKNSGVAEALSGLSLDHIVVETDAPYLSPVPFRGKRNEPSYMVHVVEKLAGIFQTEKEEVEAITTRNAELIFKT